ncbi:MAG TPA: hypothetical protein VMO26_22430 [Vicinamibacterales bacterium]|nr:hypothetical protein [Vicinamibacterales bacterium]
MRTHVVLAGMVAGALALAPAAAAQRHSNALIDLWMQGKPAFGVFVPNEAAAPPRPSGTGGTGAAGAPGARGAGQRAKPVYTQAGGEKLAANPLYDYLFLNLEGSYDGEAVTAIARGLAKGAGSSARKSLIVRVPAWHDDPAQARVRMREVFAAGADGITFPHVRNLDEARQIIGAAQAEKINVWSPENPRGDKLLMMMLEDPDAVAQSGEFANLKGYSILACGIGSLRGALEGDAAAAEAGTQKVLAETKRARLPNMLTANAKDVEQRIKEGFLGLLMQGQNADEAIRVGRKAAGR